MTKTTETKTEAPSFGYLVPEFPGQTHTFFRREIAALEERGAVPLLFSTRPPRRTPPHDWASALAARTTYLAPTAKSLPGALLTLLAAGPRRWARCLGATLLARGLGLKERLQVLALTIPAATLVRHARATGLSHVHAHFAASGAHVVMLSRLLGGPGYSLSSHGHLWTFGGNQRNK